METQFDWKHSTLKEKLIQLWEYYKLPIFGVILVLAIIIYAIYQYLNPEPEVALTVAMVNTDLTGIEGGDFIDNYLNEFCDPENEQIDLNTSLAIVTGPDSTSGSATSLQVFVAMIAAEELDVVFADTDTLSYLSSNSSMLEPEEYLTKEEMELFEPYFIYTEDSEGNTIACGIDLSTSEKFQEAGLYSRDAAIGIASTTHRTEKAVEFLHYVFS